MRYLCYCWSPDGTQHTREKTQVPAQLCLNGREKIQEKLKDPLENFFFKKKKRKKEKEISRDYFG